MSYDSQPEMPEVALPATSYGVGTSSSLDERMETVEFSVPGCPSTVVREVCIQAVNLLLGLGRQAVPPNFSSAVTEGVWTMRFMVDSSLKQETLTRLEKVRSALSGRVFSNVTSALAYLNWS